MTQLHQGFTTALAGLNDRLNQSFIYDGHRILASNSDYNSYYHLLIVDNSQTFVLRYEVARA